jgi:Flp pilus assembly protein TadG
VRAEMKLHVTGAVPHSRMRCEGTLRTAHIRAQRSAGCAATMTQQSTGKHSHPRAYRGDSGQSLVEYLLLLPLLLLLVVNVVNFGGFFFAWITVANGARAGADYQVLGGASAGSLSPATGTQISTMIAQDIAWLPNTKSLSVNICQNNNGTVTALAGSCSSVPSDPEPGNYVLTTTDVTYTYRPLIKAGFAFPNLNVYATIPPTTVHRRAVMRSLQ